MKRCNAVHPTSPDPFVGCDLDAGHDRDHSGSSGHNRDVIWPAADEVRATTISQAEMYAQLTPAWDVRGPMEIAFDNLAAALANLRAAIGAELERVSKR